MAIIEERKTAPPAVSEETKAKIAELQATLAIPSLPDAAKKAIEQEIQKLGTTTVKNRLEDLSDD